MKKTRLNSSVLAATTLASASAQQVYGETLTLTADDLGAIAAGGPSIVANNSITRIDLTAVDGPLAKALSAATLDFATALPNLRSINANQFLDNLNIILPNSFFYKQNDSFGYVKINITGDFNTSDEQTLDLSHILNKAGHGVTLDTSAGKFTKINAGVGVHNLIVSGETESALTAKAGVEIAQTPKADGSSREALSFTPEKPAIEDTATPINSSSVTIVRTFGSVNIKSVDASNIDTNQKDLNLSDIPTVTSVKVASGTKLGSLTLDGSKTVETNASAISSVAFSGTAVTEEARTSLESKAETIVAPQDADLALYTKLTNLDFSKFKSKTDSEATASATRILAILNAKKDLDDANEKLITYVKELTVSAAILNKLIALMGTDGLNGFIFLKRLHIKNSAGVYESINLTKADLPTSLEEYYSKELVVRKGTLTAALSLDAKFAATTLDLEDLNINGQTITVASPGFTASKVSTLKLSPTLSADAISSNLISAGANKTITVKGTITDENPLNTANFANVGTIDLSELTGATGLSAPLDNNGNSSNLTQLKLPAGFDVTLATLANATSSVNVVFSGAYTGAQVLNAAYDNANLNLSAVTGGGLFQVPAGVQSLMLGNGVGGVNSGAAATATEFELAALTQLTAVTGIPISATRLTLNNTAAASAISLNLSTLTALTHLNLGASKITSLTLPMTATLIEGPTAGHLDLSTVQNLRAISGLNELLAAGYDAGTPENSSITTVSFPLVPDAELTVNIVSTRPGVNFNNLASIPQLTLDADYMPGGGGGAGAGSMWPTVQDKTVENDWVLFFNYLKTQPDFMTNHRFDLSGQAITSQAEATAMIGALNQLSSIEQGAMQTLIIRLNAGASAIDLSTVSFAPTSKIIVDRLEGATGALTTPGSWSGNVVEYARLADARTSQTTFARYLNYRFATSNDKGEEATSLDLSSIELSGAEWTALMNALNAFADVANIITVHVKAEPGSYNAAPVFTTANLSNATSIVIDVTNVKDEDNSQVTVDMTGANIGSAIVEQRVTTAADVDRSSSASWQGHIEYLLKDTSGTAYTLDLTATALNISSSAELTALNTALAALSAANKEKIQTIKLKIAAANINEDITISTDLTGFTNIANFTVNATGAQNGASVQSVITFAGTNLPVNSYAYITDLAQVDLDSVASWNYYLAGRVAGIGIASLDLTAVELTAQADATALITALHARTEKNTIASLKVKLASTYGTTFDLGADIGGGAEAAGFSHGSFAVEVHRNGANATAPVEVIFGSTVATNPIRATNTSIIDNGFNSLATFDATSAHAWLGYARTLLGAVATGQTTTLDFSNHANLAISNHTINSVFTAFLAGMNALPAAEKAKVATLKIKLASEDFGAAAADLTGLNGFGALANVTVERNGARANANAYSAPVIISAPGTLTINDPDVRSVATIDATNSWLGYMRFVLNGMTGTTNTLDLSAYNINAENAAEAFNNALEALPASEKAKIQKLKLSVSSAVALGTGVSGLTNLTHLIVDQTAAPTDTIAVAAGTTANGELADAATQKLYIKDAATARDNNAWAKYIDYVMSADADGGLGLTDINLQALTLTSTEADQLFSAVAAYASDPANIVIKLNPAFGAASLAINVANFNATNITVYRNGAVNGNPASPIAITLTNAGAGTLSIVDPTANSVADTAVAQNWLAYFTDVLDDANLGSTLDLSAVAIDDVDAVTAFNAALAALPSALSNKIAVLKLNITHAADVTLGTGSNLANLTRIEYVKPVGNTVTFAGALSGKRTYLTDLSKVRMDVAGDWAQYLNYMLSTDNGGQAATSLNLSSREFASQAALDFFFADLDSLDGTYANKNVLETLRIKLADGQNALVVGRINNLPTAASALNAALRVIVDPGTSTNTTAAGSANGEVEAANLIVLASVAAVSREHIAYLVEQPGFTGTVDLSALDLDFTAAQNLAAYLNGLAADQKALIKTINLTLINGLFGGADAQLGALTGFTGVTFNVNRNGARDGANTYGALVTVTNNTGHTVNVTDAPYQDFANFDNENSAHWLGYLVYELENAPAAYVLDLSLHAALMIDSANAVSALNEALKLAPNKANVATLKVKSTVGGELGTGVTGYTALTKIIVDYAGAVVAAMTAAFNSGSQIPYHYVSNPAVLNNDNGDWTRYFDYQLNAVANGGLNNTAIVVPSKLTAADQVAAMVAGLDALDNINIKPLLATLVFDIDSTVTGDLALNTSDLTALTAATVHTNGSTAKIVPSNSFAGVTQFSSLNNVKVSDGNSWRAYFEGNTITNIDVREIEFGSQAEISAFLTGLQNASNKADVTSIKLKLSSSYSDGTVDFSAASVTGLNLGANNSVEVHRNGSTATMLEDTGQEIVTAQIKVVDLTADSLTNRANAESWRRYITSVVAGFAGTPSALDLSADSDTYVRTNADLTALMAGLDQLSAANKALITSVSIKCAAGTGWSNVADLGSELTGFGAVPFTVDVTGALSNGGDEQMSVTFHTDIDNANSKAIIPEVTDVKKNDPNSWAYYFNYDTATAVDVSGVALNSAEAAVFLGALGSGVTLRDAIDSVTFKLNSSFGAASLAIDTTGFKAESGLGAANGTAFIVQRNSATDGNPAMPIAITMGSQIAGTTLSIVDPASSDLDAVVKTSANAWLAYLTSVLNAAGAGYTLDLSDANLILASGTEATALSGALDALDASLKAKIQILKVKASNDVTVATSFATGFTNLAAIELDKPAANTIIVSTPGAAELRIASLANVKLDSADDWAAYTNYAIKDGAAALDISAANSGNGLTVAQTTTFFNGLAAISTAAGASVANLTGVIVKLAAAAGTNTLTINQNTSNLSGLLSIVVDAENSMHSGAQAAVDFSGGTFNGSTTTKEARISSVASVDRDSADSWEYYINYAVKDGAAALDLSAVTLSASELAALKTGLDNFNTAQTNKLTAITLKVSGAAGTASVNFEPTLVNQSAFSYPIVVDISGFTHNGTQAIVADGTTPANIQLQLSDTAQLVRDSEASWAAYLNYIKAQNANTMPATPDFSNNGNLYLRSQADVDALMLAIENHADKGSITTLSVRLAPGNFGSDIVLGTGTTGWNPILTVVATGAHNNGLPIIDTDVSYAGSLTSTNKTITQDFAISIANKTSDAQWTNVLKWMLSSTADGGEGLTDIKMSGALSIDTADQLAAFHTALQGLSPSLKVRVNNIMLDLTNHPAAPELGTGVTGLTNLQKVYYIAATADADATEAAESSLENKIQRLRTTWDANAVASQADVSEYLMYRLLDTTLGGLNNGNLNLTGVTLTASQASDLNAALEALPSALKQKVTNLVLDLSVDTNVTFDASGLSNLADVTYTQAGVGVITWGGAFSGVTTTGSRATYPADISVGQHWLEYFTFTINAGLTDGLLTIAPVSFTTQAQIYAAFDALELLDSALKAQVEHIDVNIASFGTDIEDVSLAATGNAALTGFSALTGISYNRADDSFGATHLQGGGVTLSRFRTLTAHINTESAGQWNDYLSYKLAPASVGGEAAKSLNVDDNTLYDVTIAFAFPNQDHFNNFLAGLEGTTGLDKLGTLTITLASTYPHGLDLSRAFVGLPAGAKFIIHRSDIDSWEDAYTSVTYNTTANGFSADMVKFIDATGPQAAINTNNIIAWVQYLTTTISEVGFNGVLNIAPANPNKFADQDQIYTLFDSLQIISSHLKPLVNYINVDISGIAAGNISLARTGDAALTGFTNLQAIYYNRGGVDADVATALTNLNAQLDTDLAAAAAPDLDGGWPYADNGTLLTAVDTALALQDVSDAILTGDAATVKSAVVAALAAGASIPNAGDRTTAVDTQVDAAFGNGGGAIYDLEAALTAPARVANLVTDVVKDGAGSGTLYTALAALTWLNNAWAGVAWNGSLASLDALIDTAISDEDENATITNIFRTGEEIRDAIKARIVADVIPATGTIVGDEANSLAEAVNNAFADDAVTTAIGNTDTGALDTALVGYLGGVLGALCPWINTNDGGLNRVTQWVNSATLPISANAGETYGWVADNMKQPLLDNLVSEATTRFRTPLETAIDTAFTDLVTNGAFELAHGFTPVKGDISTGSTAGLQSTFIAANFPWYASANVTAIATMVSDAFGAATSVNTALDAAVAVASVEGANAATLAATLITEIKTYLDDDAKMALPTADSLFATPVSTAVDAIDLNVAKTVSTYTGPTLTRFRTDINDVTVDQQSEWTDYLTSVLTPAAQGGEGLTAIDVTSVVLGYGAGAGNGAALTAFVDALNALPNTLSDLITEIKVEVSGYTSNVISDFAVGAGSFTGLQTIIVYTDEGHTAAINAPNGAFAGKTMYTYVKNVTALPSGGTTLTRSRVWDRYLSYKLSPAAIGGAEETTLDISSAPALAFASQSDLNDFFAGLNGADYGTPAAKARLTDLTIALADGNFSAATADIGETGSGAVADLKADVNVTVYRNGARNGANTYDPIVTVDMANVTTTGTKTQLEESPSAAVTTVADRSRSADWLAYLNDTLTAAGADCTLNLTGTGFQLEASGSANQATALMNALQALNSSLKAKIQTINIKLEAGNHGGDLTFAAANLSDTVGFQADLQVIVDATGALNGTAQMTVNMSNITVGGSGVKEVRVSDIAAVILDSSDSWGYYLNHLNATQGNIESIDLNGAPFTTNAGVQAFFAALEARAADKATVEDIFMEVNGGAVDFVIGDVDGASTPVTGLTALTSVVVRNTASNSITAAGDVNGVEANDLAIISNVTVGLGTTGSIVEWKGYLSYLLEAADHGGAYAGTPVALNLTATDLQVADLTRLQALEQAIAELPARLKARISGIVIKTTGTPDLTSPVFGSAAGFATDMFALKAIIIDCSSGATNLPTIQAIAGVSGIVY